MALIQKLINMHDGQILSSGMLKEEEEMIIVSLLDKSWCTDCCLSDTWREMGEKDLEDHQ